MTSVDEPVFEPDEHGSRDTDDGELRIADRIGRLVTRQPFAVLCTQAGGQPYGALVAFAFTADLKQAVFATPVATRKYRALSECDHVALVIDSRPDQMVDVMQVEAVTATGRAVLIERGAKSGPWADLLVRRHGYLRPFVSAPSCALFRIDIVRFLHVVRFQEVRQWIP